MLKMRYFQLNRNNCEYFKCFPFKIFYKVADSYRLELDRVLHNVYIPGYEQ